MPTRSALAAGELRAPDYRELHGSRIAYREVGRGPVLVLVHGVSGAMHTWDGVAPGLARRHTVITPDLPGHGLSSKPRGDYSLGAFASVVRDLLNALGHRGATVVGHSLGGGIAMQFAYQYPERCERLVLVDSGGLGDEVAPILRAATLPGAELVIPLIADRRAVAVGRWLGQFATALGWTSGRDPDEVARAVSSLSDAEARRAFLLTLRSVVDHRGQRVSARDRLHLTALMPSLVIWGGRDRVIPVAHGRRAHEEMPGSRLEVFDDAGHFPHLSDPARFVDVVSDFIASTPAANSFVGH
jgi:pimeloyl-ACP methyl ester carboxylesterase